MTCKPGDLVGIPFPYSDLSTKKRRPVLVLTAPDRRGDFMGVAVTSVLTEKLTVPIDQDSLMTGKLPKESRIRYDKLLTLSSSIVMKTYGSIKDDVFRNVLRKLCDYLGCNL